MIRSITDGTCAFGGRHTPGSEAEAECPVLLARKRSAAARKAAETRSANRQGGSSTPAEAPQISTTPSGGRPKGSTTGGRLKKKRR
jgi:hypothetical protein